MKKLLMVLAILAMFLPVVSHAQGVCFPSGAKDDDALIYKGKGTLCSLAITTDGTNQCSVIFYDALTATSTAITPVLTCPGPSTSSGPNTCIWGNIDLGAFTGIYADMTKAGGTCSYNVGRRKGH